MTQPAAAPVVVDAFVDFHCAFSYRIVAWLDDLGPERVTVHHHLFAIEQVNRDPTATGWRLWDQPLDYRHWKDIPDKRPLLSFLAMAIVEASEPADIAQSFRLLLYMAKFDAGKDIAQLDIVEQVARMSGVAEGRISAALADPVVEAAARARIAADWALARSEYAIFGVPTLRLDGGRPMYMRLADAVPPADGPRLLETLCAVRHGPPEILELKLAEPVEHDPGTRPAASPAARAPQDSTPQGPRAVR